MVECPRLLARPHSDCRFRSELAPHSSDNRYEAAKVMLLSHVSKFFLFFSTV